MFACLVSTMPIFSIDTVISPYLTNEKCVLILLALDKKSISRYQSFKRFFQNVEVYIGVMSK